MFLNDNMILAKCVDSQYILMCAELNGLILGKLYKILKKIKKS